MLESLGVVANRGGSGRVDLLDRAGDIDLIINDLRLDALLVGRACRIYVEKLASVMQYVARRAVHPAE